MYEVKKRPLKITADEVYSIGETVPYSVFESVPERIRGRRIQTLISFGRLEEIPDVPMMTAQSAEPIKKRGRPKKEGEMNGIRKRKKRKTKQVIARSAS